MNKQTKKLYDQAVELSDELDDNYSYYDRDKYYSVNVKLYNNQSKTVDELVETKDKKYRDDLKEYFTYDYVYDIYNNFIGDQQEYVVDCIKHVVHLDKSDDDYKQFKTVSDLTSNVYFLGRMGGHLSLDINNYGDILDDFDTDYDDPTDVETLQMYIDDMQAIKYVLDYYARAAKSLDFSDELDYRIDEYIDELDLEYKTKREIETAIRLANKHGYIVAREIKR